VGTTVAPLPRPDFWDYPQKLNKPNGRYKMEERYGYCKCGCNQKTWLATKTSKKRGTVKGEHLQFIHGHHNKLQKKQEIHLVGEPHLCDCGCGEYTKIAKKTDRGSGRIKGRPMKFIKGHSRRVPSIIYEKPVLCMCGCGEEVSKSKANDTTKGYKKGEAKRFISGHNGEFRNKNIYDIIKASIVVNNNGCWEWSGGKDSKGYGMIGYRNKHWFVHRLFFLLSGGVLTEEKDCVCHHCDNPACVRPDHLFAGDAQDNYDDSVIKGRRVIVRGEEAGNAKLTEEQVRRIKILHETKNTQYTILGKEFGISAQHASLICKGRTWKHLW